MRRWAFSAGTRALDGRAGPGKDVPIALLTGVAVVVVFYVQIQVVAIGTLPDLAGRERPLSDAALGFMGRPGAVMITLGIVVSLAGNLNILMLSASRILCAAAEHGQLPGRSRRSTRASGHADPDPLGEVHVTADDQYPLAPVYVHRNGGRAAVLRRKSPGAPSRQD
jgi:hypothetical protein